MVVTEEEAEEKWCPAVRLAATTKNQNLVQGINRLETVDGYLLIPISGMCIGSECMLWIWVSDKDKLGSCGLVRNRDS